jgi:hypothetical protein
MIMLVLVLPVVVMLLALAMERLEVVLLPPVPRRARRPRYLAAGTAGGPQPTEAASAAGPRVLR